MKKIILITLLLPILANAQLAVVNPTTDPATLAMSASTIAANAKMVGSLLDQVNSIHQDYKTIVSNKDISSRFAAFSNVFGGISGFMDDYVCTKCTPEQVNQWDNLKDKLAKIDGDLCKNVSSILKNNGTISNHISSLSQDISSLMNTTFTGMTPAQTAATQAKLLGALATGIQQTNTLSNAAIQMQTAETAKKNMEDKNAQMLQQSAFTNVKGIVKP